MDIKPSLTQENRSTIAQLTTESLNLKLNQQLEVKVISTKAENQTIILEIIPSNKSIQLQSNQALEIKPGQTLNIIVSKLTPAIEFKVAENSENKPLKSDSLVLKTIISAEQIKTVPNPTKTFSNLSPTVISAKIISINDDTVQLKLYTSPSIETSAYSKNSQQSILQQQNPVITLKKQNLVFTETKNTKAGLAPAESSQIADYKPGQKIQLEVNKSGLNPEFKIVNTSSVNLIKGQIITATVVGLEENNIKLGVIKSQSIASDISNKLVVSVTEKQLSYSSTALNSKKVLPPPLLNQQLLLEVKKTGEKPEFKIIEITQPKVVPRQVITASIVGFKNNRVQLQVQTPVNENSSTSSSPIITINKQQLLNSITSSAKDLAIQPGILKLGQPVRLEVIQTDNKFDFKILASPTNPEQKVLDTMKQVFPIQEQPSELINQLVLKLPLINKNEKVPEALKRLAKEILNSIPQLKEIKDHSQVKKMFAQSGLFLEAKLAQSMSNNDSDVQTDFKNLLLKFQQVLKQEIELHQDKKALSNEINLFKEMQQKTESSLAKIILNQLTSLPKEDSTRLVWLLDLPFLNNDKSETVRVEVNREQQQNNVDDMENWSVTIIITPKEQETIHCKVSCSDQTINTLFWSDNEELVKKINSNLDYLKTQFEKSGLKLGHMSANNGTPTTETFPQIKGQKLFDQKV